VPHHLEVKVIEEEHLLPNGVHMSIVWRSSRTYYLGNSILVALPSSFEVI
jgi:hypothetical protein